MKNLESEGCCMKNIIIFIILILPGFLFSMDDVLGEDREKHYDMIGLVLEDRKVKKPYNHIGYYNESLDVTAWCRVFSSMYSRGGIRIVEERFLVYDNRTIGYSYGDQTLFDYVFTEDYGKTKRIERSSAEWNREYFEEFGNLRKNYKNEFLDTFRYEYNKLKKK